MEAMTDPRHEAWKELIVDEPAEVERLQLERDRTRVSLHETQREVERLREEHGKQAAAIAYWMAEVERLRAQLTVVHEAGSRECQRQGKVPCSGCDR